MSSVLLVLLVLLVFSIILILVVLGFKCSNRGIAALGAIVSSGVSFLILAYFADFILYFTTIRARRLASINGGIRVPRRGLRRSAIIAIDKYPSQRLL